jgi:hypothetical protein
MDNWYENFDELWNEFILSNSINSLLKLKKFIELDIDKSKNLDSFSNNLLKKNPNRKIYLEGNIEIEDIDPNPVDSWISQHDSPIFEKSGTDGGYIILKWMIFILCKENASIHDIEITRFIGKCFSHIYPGRLMCDCSANNGNLILLINLHDVGLIGFCELDNALDQNRLEILKYLYYDKNTPWDSILERQCFKKSLAISDFLKKVNPYWKEGEYLNLNIKPVKY